MNNTHVARTSRNKVSTTWDLNCCLVPQCEGCALAALPFQSQQRGAWTRMWRLCQVQPSKKDHVICAVYWKNQESCCNLSVGVALKVCFPHAQYMKMTRDEHVLGFKSYDISIYWLILKLTFLFKQYWFGIDDFLTNFFATFVLVLGLQITVTFGSVLGLQVTVGQQVNTGLQPPTRWEPFVVGTTLCRPEPTK